MESSASDSLLTHELASGPGTGGLLRHCPHHYEMQAYVVDVSLIVFFLFECDALKMAIAKNLPLCPTQYIIFHLFHQNCMGRAGLCPSRTEV